MEKLISLYSLEEGKIGIVSRIKENPIRSRIMEMGIIPGKEITNFTKAPFNGPLYSYLDSFFIATRKEEADLILVKIKED